MTSTWTESIVRAQRCGILCFICFRSLPQPKHRLLNTALLQLSRLGCDELAFHNEKTKESSKPGIEPGSPAWQASILPLNHLDTAERGWRSLRVRSVENTDYKLNILSISRFTFPVFGAQLHDHERTGHTLSSNPWSSTRGV